MDYKPTVTDTKKSKGKKRLSSRGASSASSRRASEAASGPSDADAVGDFQAGGAFDQDESQGALEIARQSKSRGTPGLAGNAVRDKASFIYYFGARKLMIVVR